MIGSIADNLGTAVKETFGVEVQVPTIPFPRLSMEEAHEVLQRDGHAIPGNTKQGDLDPEGERALGRYIGEHYGHQFVFITDYPWNLRPFYHMRHAGGPSLTKSFDLLWNGVEVTTGAQREHRYETPTQQAEQKGVDVKQIQYYLNFFRYGCPPHGGPGFGLTRMLMVLLEVPNVREVTYLYRGPKRLTP